MGLSQEKQRKCLPQKLIHKVWILCTGIVMKQNVFIILASGSPRRRQLFEQARLEFEVIVSDIEERITESEPQKIALELSDQKCKAVCDSVFSDMSKGFPYLANEKTDLNKIISENHMNVLVVGADTVVAREGIVLGKPADEQDALRSLMLLSGCSHEVYTGVTCRELRYDSSRECFEDKGGFSFFSKTIVNMFPFSEAEALDYISTGEPMDKAGSYGIQGIGERLVESIEGDYNNVVGFPLSRFMKELSLYGYISYGK